jgi:hypothetical protein
VDATGSAAFELEDVTQFSSRHMSYDFKRLILQLPINAVTGKVDFPSFR